MRKTRGTSETRKKPYIHMVLIIFYMIFASVPRRNIRISESMIWSLVKRILLAGTLALSPTLEAQDLPEASLLPWQFIGLDSDFLATHKASLDALHKELSSIWIDKPAALDTVLTGRNLPLNRRHALHRVLSGRAKSSIRQAHIITPILCPVAESLVFGLQVSDLASNVLIGAQQIFTAKNAWQKGQAIPIHRDSLRNWPQNLATATYGENPAFKLALRLLRGADSSREGTHHCLNMLVAQELMQTIKIPALIDHLELVRLRETLLPDQRPSRATRTLLFDWGPAPQGPRLEARVHYSESVLAGMPRPIATYAFTVLPAENRMQLPDNFFALLKESEQQLLAKDQPMVSKVYGAWAYLDRGRAWGLNVNDRLYLEDGGRRVKGHVIGFYGAEQSIKSPRGFTVEEGAILFIRKGQKEVKVGDAFVFDPTRYPTAWPPQRQPQLPSQP